MPASKCHSSASIFYSRRQKLLKRLQQERIDAILVIDVSNVRYLSGFSGEDSALLVTKRRPILITDGRYATQAREEMRGIGLYLRRGSIIATAAKLVRESGLGRIGVEAGAMTIAQHEELERALAGLVGIVPLRGVVEGLRERKDNTELAAIMQAIAIAESAFADILPHIQVGVTERSIAAALDAAMRRRGADAAAFETIVAAGERAALPHARPTDRRIREGDCVLIDWGARRDLYKCDLTRVVFVSRISPRWERLYQVVLEAQMGALRRIVPGRQGEEVDAAARQVMKSHRCASLFTHALGHGVGLNVHEAPAIARGQKTRLRTGMVFTVEPGVYVPGECGIRIEDMVVVRPGGCRILTRVSKSLKEAVLRR